MSFPQRMNPLAAGLALLALGGAPALQAQTVYSNDFDSAPTVAAGVNASFAAAGGATVATIAPYAATYGNLFRNNSFGTTQIMLSNLPSHTSVDLSFILAFLDSWDGRTGSPAPDNMVLSIDGVQKASYTYNNASGTEKDFGGGALLLEYLQFDSNLYYTDSVADMNGDPALSFAHSASTLTIGFAAFGDGWQGETVPLDEAWGIDNLTVSLGGTSLPVPEPGSWALMALGLGALAARGLRRRKA